MNRPTAHPGATQPLEFTHRLIRENHLDRTGFQRWIFHSGMLFNAPDKWWGDFGRRDFPHEGLDFCLYRDKDGRIASLDETTRIPAVKTGRVMAVFKDYLGQAVVVEHPPAGSESQRWLTFYAHTHPVEGLAVGTVVTEGEVIATLADTSRSKAGILPHLHFSLGLTSAKISYQWFEWNVIRSDDITLRDPLSVLDGAYEIMDPGRPDLLGR